ncbi:MAG: alpha/beta hydrolase fold domain-containing protein [Actinomycetota bacterium]
MKVSTARRILGVFQRLPVGFYIWSLDQQITMEPSRKIKSKHAFEKGSVAGVDVGWLDRHNADRGVLVHVHGGGYTSGPFAAMWDWLADLCARTGMAGVMMDYRLGGAAAHPAAPDDTEAVILQLGKDGALDAPWAMIGDSAGGGLSLVTTRRLLDGNGPVPNCLILASPFVDMRLDHPDIPRLDKLDPSISVEMLERGKAQYAPGRDYSDPELSPTEARLDDLPPVHLRVGSDEIFLPDIEIFHDKLVAAGVEVDFHVEPGGIHVYPMLIDDDMCQRALASQAQFVHQHLGLD